MKKITIAFDIDGTLRNNKKEYPHGCTKKVVVNEEIRTLLITLSKFKNIKIFLWSGAGGDYAKDIRRIMCLEKYIKEKNVFGKLDKIDGKYFEPDIAIDDTQVCSLGGVNLIVKQK